MISVKFNFKNYLAPHVGRLVLSLSRKDDIVVSSFCSVSPSVVEPSVGAEVVADLRPAVLVLHPERVVTSSFNYTPDNVLFDSVERFKSLDDSQIFEPKE